MFRESAWFRIARLVTMAGQLRGDVDRTRAAVLQKIASAFGQPTAPPAIRASSRNSNPHDSLIPLPFARAKGLFACDAHGRPFTPDHVVCEVKDGFPSYPRLESMCYFTPDEQIREAVFEVLADERNLHPWLLQQRRKA